MKLTVWKPRDFNNHVQGIKEMGACTGTGSSTDHDVWA